MGPTSGLGAAGAGWGLRDGKELFPRLLVPSLPRPKRVLITELQNGLWRSWGGWKWDVCAHERGTKCEEGKC